MSRVVASEDVLNVRFGVGVPTDQRITVKPSGVSARAACGGPGGFHHLRRLDSLDRHRVLALAYLDGLKQVIAPNDQRCLRTLRFFSLRFLSLYRFLLLFPDLSQCFLRRHIVARLLGDVSLSTDGNIRFSCLLLLLLGSPLLDVDQWFCVADRDVRDIIQSVPIDDLTASGVKLDCTWLVPLQHFFIVAFRHDLRVVSSAVTRQLGQDRVRLAHLLFEFPAVVPLDLRFGLFFEWILH